MHVKESIFAAITKIVNSVLLQDPDLSAILQNLNGKWVIFKIEEPTFDIFVNFFNDGVKITTSNPNEDIQVTISGSMQAFAKLLLKKNKSLRQPGLTIQGDTVVAELLYSLFKQLDIDWEELTSKITGDTFAHQLANFAKNSRNKTRHVVNTFTDMLNEYLVEESNLIVSPTESDDFNQSVDLLREDFDRLQAKLNFVELQLQGIKENA